KHSSAWPKSLERPRRKSEPTYGSQKPCVACLNFPLHSSCREPAEARRRRHPSRSSPIRLVLGAAAHGGTHERQGEREGKSPKTRRPEGQRVSERLRVLKIVKHSGPPPFDGWGRRSRHEADFRRVRDADSMLERYKVLPRGARGSSTCHVLASLARHDSPEIHSGWLCAPADDTD